MFKLGKLSKSDAMDRAAELLKRFYPSVPLKKTLGEFETLLANAKIKRLLGFKPAHDWRSQIS